MKLIKLVIRYLVTILVVVSVQSCGTFLELVHGPAYTVKTAKTLKQTLEMVDSTGVKSIMLVPMVHIGAKEDYEKITYFVDGLKSNGYVTFYEGLGMPDSEDSLSLDTLLRKYRRIIGSSVSNKYSQLAAAHKYWTFQHLGMLINDMHLSTENDIHTDVTIAEFVDFFESKYGTVPLDDYDMSCPLTDYSYKRKLLPDSYWPMLQSIQNFRDERLLEHVLNDGYDKIAVLYGSRHTCRLKFTLHSRYGYRYKYPKK